jgi:hypothetical protein
MNKFRAPSYCVTPTGGQGLVNQAILKEEDQIYSHRTLVKTGVVAKLAGKIYKCLQEEIQPIVVERESCPTRPIHYKLPLVVSDQPKALALYSAEDRQKSLRRVNVFLKSKPAVDHHTPLVPERITPKVTTPKQYRLRRQRHARLLCLVSKCEAYQVSEVKLYLSLENGIWIILLLMLMTDSGSSW